MGAASWATRSPFDYRARGPGPGLERAIESLWYARGTVPYTRERIAPTGSTVAIFVLGDPMRVTPDNGQGDPMVIERGIVIGPHDRPLVNEPLGETFAVGVVTTAVGCRPAMGLEPLSLRGRAVDIETAWPVGRSLRAELEEAVDPASMLELVETRLQEVVTPDVRGIERCARAVALLEAKPTRAIASIAGELGISHGYLDREFTRVVGLTPRVLARLLRMRRLLAGLDVRGEVAWADLSAELGWYDQAHLIRDFRRHTGVSPSHYLAAQRANFTPVDSGDAAGFVPER